MDFSPITELARLLSPLTTPWWLAGGWAVDAHIGRVTRRHADADVLVLQRDLAHVAAVLPHCYAEIPETGDRVEWDRRSPLEPGRGALALDADLGAGIHKLQLLVGLVDDEANWIYHRGRRTIRLPLAQITRRTPDDVPYLAPHVILLFKSRQLRPKDTVDVETLLRYLTVEEREWLQARIEPWRRDHPWLRSLCRTE